MYKIDYHPPYDWQWMLNFLKARAVAGIEVVGPDSYQRSFSLDGACGLISLSPNESASQLEVSLSDSLQPHSPRVLACIRRLLDLDTDPQPILASLGELAAARPGLRLPGCMDPFEQAIRAILGQLVSVAMAAKLTAKLVRAFGKPMAGAGEWYLFPTPQTLAHCDPLALKALGMPLRRAEAIIHLARQVEAGRFPLQCPPDVEQGIKQLMTLPGIGRWTANYFALRGWQSADIFLADDYLVKKRFSAMTPAQTRRYAERWHPWQSYALLHIWHNDGWQPSA